MTQPDQISLLINGYRYAGWQSMEIARGIDRCVSGFRAEVSERWGGNSKPWPIMPFDVVQVMIGNDLVLTGYVETYRPRFDAAFHGVRASGHSKTKQIVDCNLDIPSGQFSGFTVAAIAAAVAKIFSLGVVIQTPLADQVVINTNVERCETAFRFLERLGRMAGVLLTADSNGNLVLTTAASTKSTTTLTQGVNILAASADLDVSHRFSDYIVKGQAAIGGGSAAAWGGAGGIGANGNAPAGMVETQMRAAAHDAAVPLYRPKVTIGETQLTLAQMQARAIWQRQFAYGQATKASVTVSGFRQNDGTLWQPNQIVPARIPYLGIDADLLVVRVRYRLDGYNGHVTELDLGPVEGYMPDPGEVKLHKVKGAKGGSGINWGGAGGS